LAALNWHCSAVADPGGLIRPWPPFVLTIVFGSHWLKKKMIVKDETGEKTTKKVMRKKIRQKSGL